MFDHMHFRILNEPFVTQYIKKYKHTFKRHLQGNGIVDDGVCQKENVIV